MEINEKLAQNRAEIEGVLARLDENQKIIAFAYAKKLNQHVKELLITRNEQIGIWCLSDNPETIFEMAIAFDFILVPPNTSAYTACNAIGWERLRNPHRQYYCMPDKKLAFRRNMGLDK